MDYGKYFSPPFTETPTEYFRKKHDLIHKALKFVREKAQIRPTMELVVADQDIIEVLGEATAASILLAKEQNIPLYSDDLRVRILAHQQWGVNGFDSQTVLRDIYGRSMLSASDYYKAVIRLVQSNYHEPS